MADNESARVEIAKNHYLTALYLEQSYLKNPDTNILEKVLSEFRSALQIFESLKHPMTLNVACDFGNHLFRRRNYEEANQVYSDAINRLKENVLPILLTSFLVLIFLSVLCFFRDKRARQKYLYCTTTELWDFCMSKTILKLLPILRL